MSDRLFNPRLLIPRGDDHRAFDPAFGRLCRGHLQRRQPPHPADVPERGERPDQEQRSRPDEYKSRPHGLVARDNRCFFENKQCAHPAGPTILRSLYCDLRRKNLYPTDVATVTKIWQAFVTVGYATEDPESGSDRSVLC